VDRLDDVATHVGEIGDNLCREVAEKAK
jgi:hypothetical protein